MRKELKPKLAAAKIASALLLISGGFMSLGALLSDRRHGFFAELIALCVFSYLPFFCVWRLIRWIEDPDGQAPRGAFRAAPFVGGLLALFSTAATLRATGAAGAALVAAAAAVFLFRLRLPAAQAAGRRTARPASGEPGLWRRAGERFDSPPNALLQLFVMLAVELPESLRRR